MKPAIRIESDGRGTGTRVVHVDSLGVETDLSRIITRVSWDCSACDIATAEITTLPAKIVAQIAPDLVRFLPEPDSEEVGA